jgi:hypothetical protein
LGSGISWGSATAIVVAAATATVKTTRESMFVKMAESVGKDGYAELITENLGAELGRQKKQ